MCDIVMMILATVGLCGGISIKNLCIGILITSGIRIMLQAIAEKVKREREEIIND